MVGTSLRKDDVMHYCASCCLTVHMTSDNNIQMDVHSLLELKRLANIHQVLIQNNDLYGVINASFFHDWPQSWRVLNLGLNRRVSGCLHFHEIPAWVEFVYGGTGLRVSTAC
jgi:hypothetical protein